MRDPIDPDTNELRGPTEALAQLDGATSDLNAEALEGRAVGRHPGGREMALGVSTDAFGGLVRRICGWSTSVLRVRLACADRVPSPA